MRLASPQLAKARRLWVSPITIENGGQEVTPIATVHPVDMWINCMGFAHKLSMDSYPPLRPMLRMA